MSLAWARGSILDQSSVATGKVSCKNMASFDIATWIEMWQAIAEEEFQTDGPHISKY